MNEAQVKHMVTRFLNWKLPENFNPDGGISFKKEFNEHTAHPMKHEPSGTNVLDAMQATEMVRHMIYGLPDGEPEAITKDMAFEALNVLCTYFHERSKKNGWWLELKELPSGHKELIDHTTYEDPFFIATKIALIHSEASEGLEGFRKDLPDDKLPQYPALAVELADGIIRDCDLAGRFNYQLGTIAKEKDAYNDVREDHKIEARLGKFGKKF